MLCSLVDNLFGEHFRNKAPETVVALQDLNLFNERKNIQKRGIITVIINYWICGCQSKGHAVCCSDTMKIGHRQSDVIERVCLQLHMSHPLSVRL